MGELLAALVWVVGAYFVGVWQGRRGVERKLRDTRGTAAGRCRICGVPIEGGSWDMEAHELGCRPPRPAGGS